MTAEAHVAITTPLYDLELEQVLDGDATCGTCGDQATHSVSHPKCQRLACALHAEIDRRVLAECVERKLLIKCAICSAHNIDPADITIRPI